ncbi:MAG: FAD:protein FMN transferase [Acidobacteriaceae bacterium]
MRWSSRVPGGPPQRPDLTASVLSPDLSFDQAPVFRKHFAMGAVFEIVTYGTNPTQASQAMDRAFQEMDRLEQVMSIYKPASELSQLNRTAHLQAQTASPDLYQVIQESLYYSELSEGEFDVTTGPLAERWKAVGRGEQTPSPAEEKRLRCGVGYRQVELIPPNRIRFHSSRLAVDLGAIGKGYAVDRAAAVLRSCGIECALMNSGGSTFYAMGCPPRQPGWLVHLCDPSARVDPRVLLHENSVSTSQQTPPSLLGMPSFGHIIDAIAGEPLKSATAVNVVAESATASDALSTAFLLMGPAKGLDLVKRLPNVAAIWISPEGLTQSASSGPEIYDDKPGVDEPSKSRDTKF